VLPLLLLRCARRPYLRRLLKADIQAFIDITRAAPDLSAVSLAQVAGSPPFLKR